MMRSLIPDRRENSVYEMNYAAEYASGVRGIIFDIDNTLVPQDAPADHRAAELVRKVREAGIDICLISNNGEDRVKAFAEAVSAPHYVFKAGKPSRKAYRHAMEVLGTGPEETLFIGDQLFTDIFGANRAGVKNVLVSPVDLSSDLPGIRFKRKFEQWILKREEKETVRRKP